MTELDHICEDQATQKIKNNTAIDAALESVSVAEILSWANNAATAAANDARRKYYHAALRFWRVLPGSEQILDRIRYAAALNNVQLEDPQDD